MSAIVQNARRGLRFLCVVDGGAVTLTCVDEALGASPDPKLPEGLAGLRPMRMETFALSRLVFFTGTSKLECERLVRHWASFYGESDVVAAAWRCFEEAFGALPGGETSPPAVTANGLRLTH